MAEPTYEVVWPLGKSRYELIPVAKHLETLSDKTLCELWDWRFRGDEIFPIIREALARRFPGVGFVDYNVFGDTHGIKEAEVIEALPRRLRENRCDAVVSGVGA
ncbi:MAG: hypothetical protein HYX92_03215 [Chloroflexi bacterium]|nr:hypothetical protein [Chloroflexota bacterium]